jgi:4-nitrophenyl phosphatase
MESYKPHQLQFSDFADLAEKYDYFLFDCDGVLWVGDQTIEHSFSALNYLIDNNKKVYFLTNAAMRSRTELMNQKLIR